ncbi:MAG TPA: sulfatase [Thermomicrobiales bacterium]|nr:sulfatase [Thermomicrobiales bacterium]
MSNNEWQLWWRAGACTSLLALAMAVVPSSARAQQTTPPAQRPNILLVQFDDLNDWTSATGGHPQAYTPNIDALAARGTNFLNAHAQAPLCNPSRASYLTGLRPSTTGIYSLQPSFRVALANYAELADHVTLPGYFKQHGYYTVNVGKTYHVLEEEYRSQEFDRWIQPPGGTRPPERLAGGDSGGTLVDWGPWPERDEETTDYARADAAIEELRNMPRDRPFFLALGFSLPHVPIYAPQRWFDRLPLETVQPPLIKRDDRDDTPDFSWYLHWRLPEQRLAFLEEYGEVAGLTRAYLAATTYVDMLFGRVMQVLEEEGFADNTIIVVLGDHGYHMGEKEITGKNTLWEESTHVPFIFAGPGVPVRRVSDPVELLDMYPTLVELAGLPPAQGLEGLSLVPQMRGEPRTRPAITTHNQGNHTVRTTDWRYIRYADGSEELYDLRVDPNEWTNLAGLEQYREIKAELARWLPQIDRPAVPGSRARSLTPGPEGEWLWEEEPIDPTMLPSRRGIDGHL